MGNPFSAPQSRFNEIKKLRLPQSLIQIISKYDFYFEAKKISTFIGNSSDIYSILPIDDSHFASSAKDGEIRIWDIKMKSYKILAGHSKAAKLCLFNSTLVSGSRDCTVRIWSNPVKIILDSSPIVYLFASKTHIASQNRNGEVKIWNSSTLEFSIATRNSHLLGFVSETTFAICGVYHVQIWNFITKEREKVFCFKQKIQCAAITSDRVMVYKSNNEIRFPHFLNDSRHSLTFHLRCFNDHNIFFDVDCIEVTSQRIKTWDSKLLNLTNFIKSRVNSEYQFLGNQVLIAKNNAIEMWV